MSAKWIPCWKGTLLHPTTGEQVTTDVVEQSGWGRIFEVFHYNDDPQGTQRLIEAAPDLLAALEACLDYLLLDSMMEEDAAPEIASARAAIAKAKGGQE